MITEVLISMKSTKSLLNKKKLSPISIHLLDGFPKKSVKTIGVEVLCCFMILKNCFCCFIL